LSPESDITRSASSKLLVALKWFGTISGIAGATLIAANVSASGYGFVGFFLSSVCWAVAGTMMREPSIMALYFVYIAINLLGLVRWLL
jgi:hypothetical protein